MQNLKNLRNFLFFGVLLFLSSCVENSDNKFKEENLSLLIIKDKGIYHSNDKINLSVKIESSIFIGDVNLKIYGIYAKGNYKIESLKNIIIYPGKREISFEFTVPECYSCAGILPGVYNLTAELVKGEKTLKRETINLRIEQ
ncbi:MAG: hypothetical protein QXY62_03210 [Candidatus Altiarchaeota archaeon]